MDKHTFRSRFPVARWVTIGFSLILAASLPACLAEGAATPASNGDIDLARHLEGAFERVAEQTSPSVVVITTKHKAAEPESQGGEDGENGQGQQFEGSPFEFFFRHMPQQHEPDVESQGSGVILRKDGYILTNQHVIDGGGQITVLLKDGTKFTNAVVVGVDDRIDVAVIKVDGKNLPAARLGDSDAVKVGQWAIAIGAPYELDYSFTVGFVSAKSRSGVGSRGGGNAYEDYIQTDAAINPGNSGGPLLDSEGDVIGMNTAVAGTLPDGTSAQNIGFAIPAATVQSLLKSLMAGESVVNHHAFIGVEIMSNTPALQAEYGFSLSTGAVVMSVIAGTGAATGGVKQGDVIIGINGTTISGAQDLTSVLSGMHPGDRITLLIVRGTKHLTLHIALGTQPSS